MLILVLCVVGDINAAFSVNNVTGQQIRYDCLAAVLLFALVFLSNIVSLSVRRHCSVQHSYAVLWQSDFQKILLAWFLLAVCVACSGRHYI